LLSRVLVGAVVLATATPSLALDVASDVRRICGAQIDSFYERELLLEAARDLGEEGRKQFRNMVRSRDVYASCALNYLAEFEDPATLLLEQQVLRDSKANVTLRAAAIAAAGRLRDSESLAFVLAAFRGRDEELFAVSAYALGELGDERGLRALRDALRGPRRFAVVRAVGVRGHAEAVPLLIRLMDDPLVESLSVVRADLTLSLARIGTTESRAAALTLFRTTGDETLRYRLAQGICSAFFELRSKTSEAVELAAIRRDMAQVGEYPGAEGCRHGGR